MPSSSTSTHAPRTTSSSSPPSAIVSLMWWAVHTPVHHPHVSSYTRLTRELWIHPHRSRIQHTHSPRHLRHHCHLVHHHFLQHHRIPHSSHCRHVHTRHPIHWESATSHHHHVRIRRSSNIVYSSLNIVMDEWWVPISRRAHAIEQTSGPARSPSVSLHRTRCGWEVESSGFVDMASGRR